MSAETIRTFFLKNIGIEPMVTPALEGGSAAVMLVHKERYSLVLGRELKELRELGRYAPDILARVKAELLPA